MIQLNNLLMGDNIYALLLGLSTLPKELTTATCVMQSSSKELSTPVSDCVKC